MNGVVCGLFVFGHTAKTALVDMSVDTTMHIHKSQPPGDILLFLTGQVTYWRHACTCAAVLVRCFVVKRVPLVVVTMVLTPALSMFAGGDRSDL